MDHKLLFFFFKDMNHKLLNVHSHSIVYINSVFSTTYILSFIRQEDNTSRVPGDAAVTGTSKIRGHNRHFMLPDKCAATYYRLIPASHFNLLPIRPSTLTPIFFSFISKNFIYPQILLLFFLNNII